MRLSDRSGFRRRIFRRKPAIRSRSIPGRLRVDRLSEGWPLMLGYRLPRIFDLYESTANRFNRLAGLAYVCERFHSGQWSRGYRLLCRINIRWGSDNSSRLLPRAEWSDARIWAAHYTRRARKNPRLFQQERKHT